MEQFTEALKYTIPSVVVFLTAYLLLKEFFQMERKKRNQELLVDRIKISIPLRLQAYERIILLLERISPQNLVMRFHKPELPASDFHQLLVQAVREEFNHNLSQQLYISLQAWELVKGAKEEVIRQINTSAAQMEKEAMATDLGNKLLGMTTEKMAVRKALDFLKGEAAKVF